MRVWVIEDQRAGTSGGLASLLQQLADRAPGELKLLGAGPLKPGSVDWLRSQVPDLLLIDETAWPGAAWAEELLAGEPGLVVVVAPQSAARFHSLAERHPVVLLPAEPTADGLRLGLLTAAFARQRQHAHGAELERLQQRLHDRILIERAKGVLVRRLQISEEEAYNRLRVLSRRQRRPMRDIAQSFLDTQDLLEPGENGSTGKPAETEPTNGASEASLPQ
jgi:response regulator NasT